MNIPLIDNPGMTQNYGTFVEHKLSPKVKAKGRLNVLRYAAAKLIEEATEVNRLLVRHEFHEQDYDERDLWNEVGDVRFYLQVLCHYMGVPMNRIEMLNMEKLSDRGDYAAYLARKQEQAMQREAAANVLAELEWEWDGAKWVAPLPDPDYGDE